MHPTPPSNIRYEFCLIHHTWLITFRIHFCMRMLCTSNLFKKYFAIRTFNKSYLYSHWWKQFSSISLSYNIYRYINMQISNFQKWIITNISAFHDVDSMVITADTDYFISNTKKWTRMFTVSNGNSFPLHCEGRDDKNFCQFYKN